jgi:D-alanyl-D-alanine carboxypeptidase
LIGSVSKQFTSLAIAILEAERIINVNNKVTSYLPELRDLGNVTILNLIQHTSGYKDYLNMALIIGEGIHDLN